MPKLERKTKIVRKSATLPFAVGVFALLLTSILPAFTPDAYAANAAELQQRARDASSRMNQMQQGLSTALEALNQATAELQKTEDDIVVAEEEATRLEGEIEQNQAALARQADFIYRNGPLVYLEALFSSRTITDFTATLEVVDALAQNDANTVVMLRAQTREHQQVLTSLNELRDRQESVTASKQRDASAAQSLLDQQQSYISSLNSQVQEALQAQVEQQRQQEATRPAAPSGSNRPSGPSAGGGNGGGNSNAGSGSNNGGSNNANGGNGSGGGTSGGSSNGGGGGGGDYIGTGTIFTGIASWYQIGTTTANGEAFNPNAMTAAHPSLPFNTLVRVTFRGNSVVVRINDRGPFTGGRIIDLSRGAAEVIGLRSAGVGTVTVEIVQRP